MEGVDVVTFDIRADPWREATHRWSRREVLTLTGLEREALLGLIDRHVDTGRCTPESRALSRVAGMLEALREQECGG